MPRIVGVRTNGIRDASGLTAKQRLAIPIIAGAESVWKGVQECIEKKVCRMATFYDEWQKEDAFVEALNTERERIHGAAADRARNRAILWFDTLITRMLKVAMGQEKATTVELEAMKYMLDRAGIDATGKKDRANLFAAVLLRIENREPSRQMDVAAAVPSTPQENMDR